MSPGCEAGRYKSLDLPCWASVLLWSSPSLSYSYAPFWNWHVYSVPFNVRNIKLVFGFYRGSQIRDCLESQKRLWSLRFCWNCETMVTVRIILNTFGISKGHLMEARGEGWWSGCEMSSAGLHVWTHDSHLMVLFCKISWAWSLAGRHRALRAELVGYNRVFILAQDLCFLIQ